jgi:hypothetical protein
MLFGGFAALHGPAKRAGLDALARHLLPGLTGEGGSRPPSTKEMRATMVLALPIEQWSLKVSAGPPEDAREDLDRPVWAGVVPLRHRWGTPRDAPDLRVAVRPPAALERWPQGRC